MIAEGHDARGERVAVVLWRATQMTLLPPLTARIAAGGLVASQREGLHDEP